MWRNRSTGVPVIAMTMGDPAGIGPEICLRALVEPAVREACVPVVFGDSAVLTRVAKACGLPFDVDLRSLAGWRAEPAALAPLVIDCAAIDGAAVRPGEIAEANGRAAYAYIENAIYAAQRAEVAAVVTAPIHKEALHLAGVPFPGHTEIFAAHTRTARACMMLASDAITTSFVTTHIGLADVSDALSETRVLDVIELTAAAMARIRGRAPHIAVCGLNPHAGEHGLFGRGEEERIVAPAIAVARARGIRITGPLPPDAAFVPARRAAFDAFVCMYHDQGHIPFKMLAFETGVNITLGLPIVRTSVDHGTAFDIAWQGKADPTSLYHAIFMAAKLAAPTASGAGAAT